MLGKGSADKVLQCGIKVICLLQLIGKPAKLFCHNGVKGNVGTGHGLRRTQHTEFKFGAGERKRTGAVTVSGVLRNGGQNVNANAHQALFRFGVVCAVDDRFDNSSQFVTQEDRNNGKTQTGDAPHYTKKKNRYATTEADSTGDSTTGETEETAQDFIEDLQEKSEKVSEIVDFINDKPVDEEDATESVDEEDATEDEETTDEEEVNEDDDNKQTE